MELSGKLKLCVKLGIFKKQQNMERFKFTENPRVAYMTTCNLPCCHHHPTADRTFAPISDPYYCIITRSLQFLQSTLWVLTSPSVLTNVRLLVTIYSCCVSTGSRPYNSSVFGLLLPSHSESLTTIHRFSCHHSSAFARTLSGQNHSLHPFSSSLLLAWIYDVCKAVSVMWYFYAYVTL